MKLCWSVLMMSLFSSPASAQEPAEQGAINEAEANRLRANMAALASKNVWTGVNSKYEDLQLLGVQLSQADHHAGADAASSLGDVLAQRERLALAGEAGDETVWPRVKQIDADYGALYLLGASELTVVEMPFDPGPRGAIGLATSELHHGHAFYGMLPVGGYTFRGLAFEVESDARPMLLTDAGPALLRDPLGAIQPQGDTYLWNGVELDWPEARAVLYTRPESAAVLQGSARERAVALGLVGGGVGAIVLGRVACQHPSPCGQVATIGAVAAIGTSVPLLVRARSDKSRAVRAWTEAWASHERGG